MNQKLFPIITILAILLILGGIFYFSSPKQVSGDLDGFAICLRDKAFTMYGAVWCSHCQNEKNAFGSSFQYVPYVECPDNINFCLEKGVEGYPTWIGPDGIKLVGEQGVNKLSQISGCPLSGENSPTATSTTATSTGQN